MRKLLLLMIALLGLGTSGAWATVDTQSYTVTYELATSTRNYSKYYRDNSTTTNNWANRWVVRGNYNLTTFPENLPDVFISSDNYCISGWDSKLMNTASSNTFTIHAPGTGVVTGYTLSGTISDTRSDKTADFTKTITPSAGGSAQTWTKDDNTSKTVTVTGLSANTATFTFSGTNDDEVRFLPSSFTMTVQMTLLNSNSDIDYSKYYYLACPRGGLSTNDGQLASTFKNDSYTMKPFAFVYSGGNYYLYSVDDNKYVSETGALEDTPSAAITISTTGKASDKYPTYVQIGSNYLRTSNYQTAYGTNTGGKSNGDAGNYYAIFEGGSLKDLYKSRIEGLHGLGGINTSAVTTAIDDASTAAGIISAYYTPLNAIEAKFYTLKNYDYNTKYMCTDGNAMTTTTDVSNAIMQFKFMPDGGFAMYTGKKKYVGTTHWSYQTPAIDTPVEYFAYYDAEKGYAFHYAAQTDYPGYAYLHCNSDGNIVGWLTSSNPTWWTVAEVDATVTYILKENNVEFLRETFGTTVGETITALPSSLQRPFTNYAYPVASLTTVAGENDFVSNVTFSMPFTASTDYASAKWYYMTMRTSWYAVYGDTPPYTLTGTQDLTDNGMWAFIGNPYTGIRVINKGAGSGKYLEATETKPTMTTTATYWEIGDNSGNFTLYDATRKYISDFEGARTMRYWSGADDGSTFRVQEAAPTIVVNKDNGTYYTQGGAAIDPTAESGYWGPTWKSTRTVGGNILLTLTTSTGMNAKTGDIYTGASGAAVRYTLAATDGYVITGYSITGTANSTDITITPRVRKSLTITSGNSGTLTVSDLDLQTTSFTLSGAASTQGHLSSVTLSVTLQPTAFNPYTPPIANNTTAAIGYKNIETSSSRYVTYMKTDAGGALSFEQVSSTFSAAPSTVGEFKFEYDSSVKAYYIKETSTSKYVYAKDDLTWKDGNRSTTENVAALGVADLPGDAEGKTIFQWIAEEGGTSVEKQSYYIRPKSNMNTAISVQSNGAGILGFYDLETKDYKFAHASLLTWAEEAELYYNATRSGNVMKHDKVGYPKSGTGTAYETLFNHVASYATGSHSKYVNLVNYYDAYIADTDIQMPTDGKVYSFTNVQTTGTKYYLNSDDGTMSALNTSNDGAKATKYICHKVSDNVYAFINIDDWNWMIAPTSLSNGTKVSQTYDQYAPLTITQFYSLKDDHCGSATSENTFGLVQIRGDRKGGSASDGSVAILSTGGAFNYSGGPYFNGSFSSAYQITEEGDYYNKVNLATDETDAYASIYLPFSVIIPSGITAYKVTSQNGVYAHMESIVTDGILPANTAAILKKAGQTTNETVYLSPATGAGDAVADNLLNGTVAAEEAVPGTGTTYVLGKIEGVIGLYEYTAANLAPGKAYLNVAAGVKALAFDFGDADGIKAMDNGQLKMDNANIYNLAGQRMNKLQRGVNIVNGKKIIVK